MTTAHRIAAVVQHLETQGARLIVYPDFVGDRCLYNAIVVDALTIRFQTPDQVRALGCVDFTACDVGACRPCVWALLAGQWVRREITVAKEG